MFIANHADLSMLCRLSLSKQEELQPPMPIYFWAMDGAFFAGLALKNQSVHVRLDDGACVKPIAVDPTLLQNTLRGVRKAEIGLNPTTTSIEIISTFGTDACPASLARVSPELIQKTGRGQSLRLEAEAVQEIKGVAKFTGTDRFKNYLFDTLFRTKSNGTMIAAGNGALYAISELSARFEDAEILLEPDLCRFILPMLTGGAILTSHSGSLSIADDRWKYISQKTSRGIPWPHPEKLLERRNLFQVVLSGDALNAAIDAVMATGTPVTKQNGIIFMSLKFDPKTLTVQISGPLFHSPNITRVIPLYDMSPRVPFLFHCCPELIADAISFINQEQVTLVFAGELEPLVLRGTRVNEGARRTAIVAHAPPKAIKDSKTTEGLAK